MTQTETLLRRDVDNDACAREPIRIPGMIQPHGALVVVDPDDFTIRQASANCHEMLGLFIGRDAPGSLSDIPDLKVDILADLHAWKQNPEFPYLRNAEIGCRSFQIWAHLSEQGLIVEFEVATGDYATREELHPILQRFLEGLEYHDDMAGLSGAAAATIREMTGFDRVLVYQFDEDWNGTVIAEENNGALPSYLDLRFPASDIPAQARALYKANRIRIIPDGAYTPVPIEPAVSPVDGQPLDLTHSVLRSVSPVHLEYMRNMRTQSSMSISIVVDDSLWGLVSCHHARPRHVGAPVRAACEMLVRILSLQIGERQRGGEASERMLLQHISGDLLTRLSRNGPIETSISTYPEAWMALARAQGAAVVIDREVECAGATPRRDQILAIVEWLEDNGEDQLFVTNAFSDVWADAGAFADVASGIIAVPISQIRADYVMWFRPEEVETVKWGGDPRKVSAPGNPAQLNPRRSFAMWKELVRRRSLRWRPAEIANAKEFGGSVVEYVLRRAEEKAALTDELETSNRELEAFSYSISHDLRAPFRQIAGFAELLKAHNALDDKGQHYLTNISEAAMIAAQLVDGLLSFAHLGRTHLAKQDVDVNKLISEVRRILEQETGYDDVAWSVGNLPPAWADPTLLRQVFQNLVGNALKFSQSASPARIEVQGAIEGDSVVYTVRDNGVGFDNRYVKKLFGVFQRLHSVEEFEGTGIGLALSKRIVDRHGGTIEADGTIGGGALFTIRLPQKETIRE